MLAVLQTSAKNYYVAANGNDANAGTSSTTPWKTISKVNSSFSSFAAGDSILFRRGDVFTGGIRVNQSGTAANPIVISAYGTGAMPIISAMAAITSWTSAGTNLWRSNTITGVKTVNVVTVNNVSKVKGRYPNSDAPSSGYLYFESYSGTSSITDNQLTGTPNWTGGTIALRPNSWTIGRYPITSHSGSTITFSGNSYSIRNNHGYFIQDHILVLDRQDEWFFDAATKQLVMYSVGTPSNVKVNTVDTLCYVYNKNYITITGLEFEGAGKETFNLNTTTGIKIENCKISNSGTDGVKARNSKSPVVQNCSITNSYNIGINLEDINNANAIVKNNTVNKSGADPGMGIDMIGIATTGNGHTIEGNRVDSSGYAGIRFQRGSNITIKNNVVNTYCFVLADAGGIYSWNNYIPATTYTNNKIIGNIVMNGIGKMDGTSATEADVDGIYMDDNVGNVEITDNTVFNVAGAGMYIHNCFNMNIQRNTLYNNGREQLNFTHNLAYVNGSQSPYTTPLRNVTFKKNILFSKTAAQQLYRHYTILNDIDSTGVTDSNWYSRPLNEANIIRATRTVSGSSTTTSYDLAAWKATFKKDAATKKLPMAIPAYSVTGVTGSNLVTNGQFNSNITGFTVSSTNNNQTASWDNTTKITGTGSLKLVFPTSIKGTYTSVYTSVGSVSSSRTYVLRFSTLGTATSGALRVYLRKTTSSYTQLTPMQSATYGTTVKNHEFVFAAPTSQSSSSVMIEVEQSSGTTYIDNVEFYQASTSATNIDEYVRFEYNATGSNKTVALDAKYLGVDSTVYTGSIVLTPYSSRLLIKVPGTTGSTTTTTTSTTGKVAEPTTDLEKVTGIEDAGTAKNTLALNCYPNPSTTSFTLAVNGVSNTRIGIVVYNSNGRMVYRTSGTAGGTYTFGNGFTPGVYIVRVFTGTETQVLRIVKAR
jgi:parallel beta-helix repeat protein